jgi:hypothetical protein
MTRKALWIKGLRVMALVMRAAALGSWPRDEVALVAVGDPHDISPAN